MDMPSIYVGWFLQGEDALVEAQSGANAFLVYQRAEPEAGAKRIKYKTSSISDLVQLPPGVSLEAALRAHIEAQKNNLTSLQIDQRFVVRPLAKSTRNPFQAKIMVGRAEINDIVLKLPSISKLHAWFKKVEDRYELFDAQSSFGTFVESARAPADGSAGLLVRSGTKIKFGEQEVSFFNTKGLSDWLKESGALI